MNSLTYYYPHKKSIGRVCALKKEQAEARIQREGGELIEVPVFLNEDDAKKWIEENHNSSDWDISFLEKTNYDTDTVYCVIQHR